MDCRFNKTREAAMKNSSSPLYKGSLICGEDLSISFHKKKEVQMKQCWAVGFSILEISKYIMQRLYYEVILSRLGPGNVSVVMSDTDSFLLYVKNLNEDEVMEKLASHMDFSNLDRSHRLFSLNRSKTPGYLKNEVPKARILEVVALKAKTYAFRTADSTQIKAKGVVQAVKEKIDFDQYKRCLQEITQHEVVQRSLRSKNHIIELLESTKIAFSSFDDKRYLLCPKHSVPYGSSLIPQEKVDIECLFCENPDLLF